MHVVVFVVVVVGQLVGECTTVCVVCVRFVSSCLEVVGVDFLFLSIPALCPGIPSSMAHVEKNGGSSTITVQCPHNRKLEVYRQRVQL